MQLVASGLIDRRRSTYALYQQSWKHCIWNTLVFNCRIRFFRAELFMAVKALKLELVINDIAIKISASGANMCFILRGV